MSGMWNVRTLSLMVASGPPARLTACSKRVIQRDELWTVRHPVNSPMPTIASVGDRGGKSRRELMRIDQKSPEIAIDATCDRRIVRLLNISTMEASNGNRQFQRTR
jgi:hypothetical protein